MRAVAHGELALAREGAYAVGIDTTLDEELVREGLARELARAINDLRKARDLDLSDRISVELRADGEVAAAAREHNDWIAGEVLAVTLDVHAPDGRVDNSTDGVSVIDVDGQRVGIELRAA